MTSKIKTLKRGRSIYLFISLSLFFFLLSVPLTDVGAPEPSVFWYASSLPFTFWLGLFASLCAIVLSISQKRKYLGLVSSIIPVLFLYSLPHIVHDMVPVFDVYHVIPSVLSIVETGTVDFARINFPGSHIFQASTAMMINVEMMTLARLFPTILAGTIALFLFTIARRISTRWAPVAPLTFLALNWYMEYHLARQPFTLMLWTAFWLALFLYIDTRSYRVGIVAAIILFALVPSHPGMLIITSFNMVVLALVYIVTSFDDAKENYLRPFIPLLIVFVAVTGIFYTFVPEINHYVDSVAQDFLERETTEFALGGPADTSIQYEFVNRLRMFSGALHSSLAFLGFITLYKRLPRKALLLGAWFFSIYLWLAYPLTHQGRYMERTFMFSLIPASILAVALLKHFSPNRFPLVKKIRSLKNQNTKKLLQVTVIVVIAALLLTVPVTKSSIDAIETPSRSAYQAGLHAERNFEERIYVTDTHEGMFRYIESKTSEDHTTTRQFRARGTSPIDQPYGYRIPRTDTQLSPILFTDYFNNYIEIRYGNTTAVIQIENYEKNISNDSNRIYDSGGARLYVEEQRGI